MNKIIFCLFSVFLFSTSCNRESTVTIAEIASSDSFHILNNRILTAEEQIQLTPDSVLRILKQGNKDFIDDKLTIRNNT